ncbi:hypothetical protein D7X30_30265 [Corallococcus sp. AB011P]|nr:hypothetical protein D7X30_30265 [Corallococcus sp. AB011P]
MRGATRPSTTARRGRSRSRPPTDGRARTLEEAVLWHGGEAERAREGFRDLSASDRDALVRFLRSL